MSAEPQFEPVQSVRAQITSDLMARTGLDEGILKHLVHGFYDRARQVPLLSPIFADHIVDWGPHLDRMVEFWPSVALMTGRYHGAPIPKHLPLPVEAPHFERWQDLFRATAQVVCPPDGAVWVIEQTERIAASIHTNIRDTRGRHGSAVLPPQL